MVAGGHHPEAISGIAKAAGHASANRACLPEPAIVELLQAERLVECFEADLWSSCAGDPADFIKVAETACAASHVAPPRLTLELVRQVSTDLRAFAAEWQTAPLGHVARFVWEEI